MFLLNVHWLQTSFHLYLWSRSKGEAVDLVIFRTYRHLSSPTWLCVLKSPLRQVDVKCVSKFCIKHAIRAEVPAGQQVLS